MKVKLAPQQNQHASRTRYPSPLKEEFLKMPQEMKVARIQEHMTEILTLLGLDLEDPSICSTPRRVAEMFVEDIFAGLLEENFPDVTFTHDPHQKENPSLILVRDITLTSFCEHHLLPFFGKAHVAYVPRDGKIIGLSKINRIVQYFARRPQVQERLGAQIADSLSTLLETPNVAVALSAKHFCVCGRGIRDEGSSAITHVMNGDFHGDRTLRQEFFNAISRAPSTL